MQNAHRFVISVGTARLSFATPTSTDLAQLARLYPTIAWDVILCDLVHGWRTVPHREILTPPSMPGSAVARPVEHVFAGSGLIRALRPL